MLRSVTLVPSQTLVRDLGIVVGGAALTAVCAQVSLPWQPVPFTLQTLSVTLCGLALGWRRGAASQAAYLAAGAAGLPVFAEGKGGAVWLFGMTGGYLWSFILAAGLCGWLAERGWDRKLLPCAAALLAANALNLLMGATWLSLFVGAQKALVLGVLPFISGAIFKSVAVVLTLPLAWKRVPTDKSE